MFHRITMIKSIECANLRHLSHYWFNVNVSLHLFLLFRRKKKNKKRTKNFTRGRNESKLKCGLFWWCVCVTRFLCTFLSLFILHIFRASYSSDVHQISFPLHLTIHIRFLVTFVSPSTVKRSHLHLARANKHKTRYKHLTNSSVRDEAVLQVTKCTPTASHEGARSVKIRRYNHSTMIQVKTLERKKYHYNDVETLTHSEETSVLVDLIITAFVRKIEWEEEKERKATCYQRLVPFDISTPV